LNEPFKSIGSKKPGQIKKVKEEVVKMHEPVEPGEKTGSEIAVIGMAGRFPGAKNIHEFWENLKNGVESIVFITDEELEAVNIPPEVLKNPSYVKTRGGIIEDKAFFDAFFFDYTPREAEIMDPQVRITHQCTWEALENAGYNSRGCSGIIGLYAGASSNSYWEMLTLVSGKIKELGYWAANYLNNKDALSTLIAYRLDLKGPSFNVQTACSTSLVAIHLACQGILNGECEIALAGGVTVSAREKTGYIYKEGMILSTDGHCRTFDAKAKGTVEGQGVGIVVLKSLEDALAHRDHIYAVVKGTAINNDGIRKIGYTAPSTEGQAEAIKMALQVAEVEPESISYIETHGTATEMGDPVEIEALKLALSTDKKGFCGIGSVKTNIGHLDAAAGVAGFIKTVLALHHRLIPPSLHFETANPRIDFENSPFYVNTTLKQWENEKYPLRAGVSSLGIGGTNAHVILEQAPVIGHSSLVIGEKRKEREYQLILLSAKTQTSLQRMTRNLADHFKENPGTNIANAAYTLNVGRQAFQYRAMLVCSTVDEIIEHLSTPHSRKVHNYCFKEDYRPVVFMFPGLGSQYENMGLDLYLAEPIFRREMDRCFDILKPLTGYDIKEILYPDFSTSRVSEEGHAAGRGQPETSPAKINQPEISSLVIFIFEYALAQLIMKWGIMPDAMVGYSFGEYVAACVSGVFSLEDALTLVVTRGRLIQHTPPGAMLSVPLTREEITPLLTPGSQLSLAIDNGPSCIVSGPIHAVDAFEKQVKDKKMLCMRVPVSRALHSPLMAPILKEFAKITSRIVLNEPGIPYISNLTGDWIRGRDAVSHAYWEKHLRETVRFAEGMEKLAQQEKAVFVEVGPGRDLTTLASRCINRGAGQQVINLTRNPQKHVSDVSFLLNRIGRLWLWGVKIDWNGFYHARERYRVPLPTYPFEVQPYWIEEDLIETGTKLLMENSLLHKKPDMADWFYIPSWKRTRGPENQPADLSADSIWLVLANDGLGEQLVKHLEKKGQKVITVKAGPVFRNETGSQFTINPRKGHDSDFDNLFDELVKTGTIPDKIVHLWSISTTRCGNNQGTEMEDIDDTLDLGFYSLLNIAHALGKKSVNREIQLSVLTNNLQEVIGQEGLCPGKAAVLGPVKVIPLEYPNIKCRTLDILLPSPGSGAEKELVDRLARELTAGSFEPVMALRGSFRWVQIFEPTPIEKPKEEVLNLRLKEEGVYLITGGLGGIGLALAEFLASNYRARLVLTGRSEFPARNQWHRWLNNSNKNNKISERIRKVRTLEKCGAVVWVAQADVTDETQMQEVVARTLEKFGPINGVIHAAGLPDGEMIQRRTRETSEGILAAKVKGTLVIDAIFRETPLDFLVLCSSIGSILAAVGQVAYTAANAFLDAFALRRFQSNQPFTTAINWERWQKVGIATIAEEMHKQLTGEDLPGGIIAEQGVETFTRILADQLSQVVVSSRDLDSLMERANNFRASAMMKEVEEISPPDKVYQRPELDTDFEAPARETETILADIWAKFFGFARVGIHDDFFELGGDSLKAMVVAARIQKELTVEVPLGEFFNRPTIQSLAHFIDDLAGKGTKVSISMSEKKEYYALSSAQQRLFILQEMQRENISYNQTNLLVLQGKLTKDKFEKTFKRLIERHGGLRTSFDMIENKPVQRVHEVIDIEFAIDYYELGKEENKQNIGAESPHTGIIKDFIRPFDLSRAPLLRVGMIKEQDTQHILMLDIHHIVSDGISMEIFKRDFMSLYSGEELPELEVQYKDFSEWQTREKKKEAAKIQETYWLKEFAGEIPILDLPTDHVRPRIQNFEGHSIGFSLEGQQVEKLKKLALHEKVTLYMILLAIYNILLSKISGQEDIVVGSPTAGRRHASLQQIMGMFVNTLPLRNYPVNTKTSREFLGEVKERTLQALANQDYSFEDLVEQVAVRRDASRNPIFDMMFVLQNLESKTVEIPGLQLNPYSFERTVPKFDLTLTGIEAEEKLFFTFEYNLGLFKRKTIEKFRDYFLGILAAVTENPGEKISQIRIISQEEKNQILHEFNNTKAVYAKDKTIYQVFAEQVEKKPDNSAVIFKDNRLSYREFNNKINQLAGVLREKGVKPDHIAALLVERSLEMMIGIFAIQKAGGAYLPIEPNYPQQRIDFLLKDSGAKLMLCLEKFLGIAKNLDFNGEVINLEQESLYQGAKENPVMVNKPGDIAYIIYTSGSTGKPKGVMIEHFPVINRLNWMQKRYPIAPGDVILQKTTYVFDVSVWELFWWSFWGASQYLLIPGGEKDPAAIIEAIEKNNISTMHFVPSMLNVFLGYIEGNDALNKGTSLKQVFASGEALTSNQVEEFNRLVYQRTGKAVLINLYGPTEATVDVSFFDCPFDSTPMNIPIGKPVDNTHLIVVNNRMKLQPVKIAGELCISGDQLARGYLNRPILTAEKFVANPYAKQGNFGPMYERLYRTGDLAHWLPDGNIEYLGRIDFQVKIRGFRIELGEIENQLLKIENIKEAVVLAKEDNKGEKYLCAYFVISAAVDVSLTRETLLKSMPDYMVPSFFVPMEKIPLTPNGKIDSRALPLPDLELADQYVAPRNEMEKKLTQIWSEVLGVEKNIIGIDANFFELGGHSLNAIIMTAKVHKEFDISVSLADLFKTPTIRGISSLMKVVNWIDHKKANTDQQKEEFIL
jgi:amino acid adenylation domain-containing protein